MLAKAGVRLVLIAFDNDRGGAQGVQQVGESLRNQDIEARRVLIPVEYNDLTDWAIGAGTAFAPLFSRALKDAAEQLIGTPGLIAPTLGSARDMGGV